MRRFVPPVIDICVPFRDDGAERSRNWEYLHGYWLRSGLGPLYVGDSAGAVFAAPEAKNAAVAQGDGDVVVVMDADMWIAYDQIEAAAKLALRIGGYVVAHTTLFYFDDTMTTAVLRDAQVPRGAAGVGRTWFGSFAVPRTLWDEVGGFDERFGAWGRHAAAFWEACRTLGGHDRVKGNAYHLWHPSRGEHVTTADAELLRWRYAAADGDPAAMRSLLDEVR